MATSMPFSQNHAVLLERVILLLKLSAAPQMAIVLAKDLLRDKVKEAESFRPCRSLDSAGKALWSR